MNTYHNSFVHTLKEAPKDAETMSHQLMVRAGLIRKLASGIYTILPLGQRVFAKLSQIIREEMIAIGGVECEMPHLIPADLWKSSGRWDQYGKELLRLNDRSDREFCFGPTHEEVITDLVNHFVTSYKQLPVCLFQIQTKFRDEIRPRFGLMRGREFLMKDAYSFHEDDASLNLTYQASKSAYAAIFSRCGLSFIEASADSGSIGGDESVEFLVIADSGEDEVLVNESAGYAANIEAALCYHADSPVDYSKASDVTLVNTPNMRTINDVAKFFSVKLSDTVKSLLLIVDELPVLVCIRGDHTLNEAKLSKYLNAQFRFASAHEVERFCGCETGFIGPVQLANSIPIYMDYSLHSDAQFICGANQLDAHYSNVVIPRDVQQPQWVDIRNAQAGDPCPLDPTKSLTSMRGIEVGHVFKLGSKYSTAMGAMFTKRNGSSEPFEMGCYGIGVGRTIAAAIEQSHDDHGIIWPEALAPFRVVILNLTPKDSELASLVSTLVTLLENASVDVIVDDRIESPGVKFKDADLIGFPYQLILGKKTLQNQHIELKIRKDGNKELISIDSLDSILGKVL